MAVRVGINGMGRIGRAFLRLAEETDDLDVVAVNDVAEPATIGFLLRRDTTFGRFPAEVHVDGDALLVGGPRWPSATFQTRLRSRGGSTESTW